MFIEHDLARHVLISVQMWLHLLCVCQGLSPFDFFPRLAQLGYRHLKKTSKLKITVLTNVITILNMPVNTDEGGQ